MIFRHMLVWPSIWLGNIVLADVVLDQEILPPDFERSIVFREALSFFSIELQSCNCAEHVREHRTSHPGWAFKLRL